MDATKNWLFSLRHLQFIKLIVIFRICNHHVASILAGWQNCRNWNHKKYFLINVVNKNFALELWCCTTLQIPWTTFKITNILLKSFVFYPTLLVKSECMRPDSQCFHHDLIFWLVCEIPILNSKKTLFLFKEIKTNQSFLWKRLAKFTWS